MRGISLQEKILKKLKNKDDNSNIESLNKFFDLLFKLYPFILGFLLLLDIYIFINVLKFDIGLITLISSDINIFSFNIIFIILLIPFFLAFYLIFGILSTYYIPKTIRENIDFIKIKYPKLPEKKKVFFVAIFSSIWYILINFLIFYFQIENFVILYILLLFLPFGYIAISKIFKTDEWKGFLPEVSSIITLAIIGAILFFYGKADYLVIYVFTFIFVIGTLFFNIEKEIKNSSLNKKKPTKSIFFIFLTIVLTFIFIGLTYINSTSWNKQVTDRNIGVSQLTFNLLFNRGLLIKNSSDIDLKVPYKYYSKRLNYLYENEDFSSTNFINRLQCNCNENSLCNIDFRISTKFWYLQVSKNIKLFVKNIPDNEEILILLVEQKKFANKNGSEYSLLDIKIK